MPNPPEAPDAAAGAAPSVAALLARPGIDPAERRILLAHVLGLSRVQLVSQSERRLDAAELARYDALRARRAAGEPIAYLVGAREFYGRRFAVSPGVLIPRPESELLVELALARVPLDADWRVLDLGTGSGVLAVSVALERVRARVTAIDISADALVQARANAAALGAVVSFIESDWYDALAPGLFELILCNPPYVAAADAHLAQGDLRFEPALALTDHGDGRAALAHVIGASKERLVPGGWLFIEHGHDQAPWVRAALDHAGYAETASWRDLAGIERVSGGQRPES